MVNETAIQCQYTGVAEGLERAAECLRTAGDPVKRADSPTAFVSYYPGAMQYASFATGQSGEKCPAALALLAIAQNGLQQTRRERQPAQRTMAKAVREELGSADLSDGYKMREEHIRTRRDRVQGLLREILSGSPLVEGPNTTALTDNPGYLCGGCKYRAQG